MLVWFLQKRAIVWSTVILNSCLFSTVQEHGLWLAGCADLLILCNPSSVLSPPSSAV